MNNKSETYLCQPVDRRTFLQAVGAGAAMALFWISKKVITVWNCVSYDGGGVECPFSGGITHV